MSKLRLAVFISGGGRTLCNLVKCSQTSHPEIFEIVLVVANKSCGGLRLVSGFGLHGLITEDQSLIESEFEKRKVDYVCLAGYLKKFPITKNWEGKVLNIHPSLIPKYCGRGWYGTRVHKAVIKAGEKESGCTVHFCDNKFDHGPILLQDRLTVDPAWDSQELAKAVFELEKKTYPAALTLLYNRQTATDTMLTRTI